LDFSVSTKMTRVPLYLRVGVAPDVVVAFGRALRRDAVPLEPGMLIRGVVDHQLREHADVEPVGGVEKRLKSSSVPLHGLIEV
jgi:hypothetical protein